MLRLDRVWLVVAGLVVAGVSNSYATDKTYIGGAGTFAWSDGTKWAGPGQPGAGDNVFAIPADPVNRTVVYDATALPVQFGTVTFSSGGSGVMSLINSGSTFRANGLVIGPNAAYINLLNGQSFVNSTTLNGGSLGGGAGTFHVTDLTQNSGTISAPALEISGRYLLQAGNIFSNVKSTGTCDVVGGATGGGWIYNYGTLNYNSAAGSLQVNISNYGVMNFLSPATIGRLDTYSPTSTSNTHPLNVTAISVRGGTFTQLANITSFADIVVGPGTWDQHGGALLLNGPNTRTVNIGSNNGVNAPLPGTFLISGGTITCDAVNVGADFSSGTLTQSGGKIVCTFIGVGERADGRGAYTVSGGTLSASSMIIGGMRGVGGSFAQSGGSILLNSITVNEDSASSGTATISGGSITTNRITNNGAFTQTGGRIIAFQELLGSGSLNVSGTGSLTASQIRQDAVHIGNGGRIAQGGSTSRTFSLVIDEVGNAVVGRWDVGSGALVDDYTGASPAAAVRRYLKSGYATGSWNGAGLNSSAAAAASPRNTSLGYSKASNLFGASGGAFEGVLVDNTVLGCSHHGIAGRRCLPCRFGSSQSLRSRSQC